MFSQTGCVLNKSPQSLKDACSFHTATQSSTEGLGSIITHGGKQHLGFEIQLEVYLSTNLE